MKKELQIKWKMPAVEYKRGKKGKANGSQSNTKIVGDVKKEND